MNIAVITPVKHLPGVCELLESKGNVFYLERGNKQEVRQLLLEKSIDVIFCNPNEQSYKIDKELLENTQVKIINSASTGLNHIDQEYCFNNDIDIQCHKNDYKLINELPSTSELALGLMMSLLRNIPESINHTKEYGWDYTKFVGRQVKGLNIGIVGFGRLGEMFAKFVHGLGAFVYIYDPYKPLENRPKSWYKVDSLEDLFNNCDVVSLHVHVTEETRYMIDKKILGLSKKKPYIINTSRGEIVDELDIINALKDGIISGYGTDVIEDEFGDIKTSPIIKGMNEGLNILVTPHTGGMTIEGSTKAYKWSINKL